MTRGLEDSAAANSDNLHPRRLDLDMGVTQTESWSTHVFLHFRATARICWDQYAHSRICPVVGFLLSPLRNTFVIHELPMLQTAPAPTFARITMTEQCKGLTPNP